MSITMDKAVDEMKLTTLTDLNTSEPQPHWGKEALDDDYALDLLSFQQLLSLLLLT